MIIIGLDIGGSMTKSILIENGEIRGSVQVTASGPLVSAAGAIGKITEDLGVELSSIDLISCTGGGSREIGSSFLGLKTVKVDEIEAIGLGGLALSGLSEAVVSSIGTGTAIVSVRKEGNNVTTRHLGGTGVGGGTLVGLSKLLLNRSSIEGFFELARKGNFRNVDLTIMDIVGGPIGRLPADTTASNFGNVRDGTRLEDIAAGLLNMVGQVIGTVTYFAAKAEGLEKKIVFIGSLPTIKEFSEILTSTVSLLGGNAIIPEMASYATALGAAIKAKKQIKSLFK
ncbi:MAG: pantothenate kinase [Thermoproteota archaeon]|nr:MAG: pantothenate kinase [Candidatus Korarchaeota archaeon]RLG53353.1 MAG: pantothenate kinase [Candidatus Korarchaeota archaeon]